jgi:hypothetical protein
VSAYKIRDEHRLLERWLNEHENGEQRRAMLAWIGALENGPELVISRTYTRAGFRPVCFSVVPHTGAGVAYWYTVDMRIVSIVSVLTLVS